MKLKNIDRVLLFREDGNGRVLSLEELRAKYGLDPDGTNFYYGINQANVDSFAQSNKRTALNPTHQAFLAALQASLIASADDEKTLMLGLEPSQAPDPYGFANAHMDLVQQLAVDLNEVQTRARAAGKRLNISLRYASEMNTDPTYGHKPAEFKTTFVAIRHMFAEHAPGVLFSFSPGLRADLPEELIGQYWPGDQYVDVIGATWYIGAPAQRAPSVANMRAYFLHRLGTGKAFALSEVGGCDTVSDNPPKGKDNDAVVQEMLHELEALQLQNVSFKYVTIFLESKWGDDATLAFLRQ
jgi:hypothetical protein